MARYSVNCSGCKAHATIELPGQSVNDLSAEQIALLAARFPKLGQRLLPVPVGASLFDAVHCCRYLKVRRIRGVVVPDHKCDARCTGAKGHDCECSCGGKNHGAGYAVAA